MPSAPIPEEKNEKDGGLGDVATSEDSNLIEPTAYEVESKASASAWAMIRNGILVAVTETSAMPIGMKCLLCQSMASYRCQQCGPLVFFCEECSKKSHNITNLFHVLEKWEVHACIHVFQCQIHIYLHNVMSV